MSNQNIEFKNHCIIKFNERFNDFCDDLFLLAFFLHPRYHGKLKFINFGNFIHLLLNLIF
jgi:hypothetical protein